MNLSTKGIYGLEALLDLAIHSNNEYIPISEIAKRRKISGNYLEQLFLILRKSGIVRGFRGSQGGYMLARNPSDISVWDIINTLEGTMAPVPCLALNNEGCSKSDRCPAKIYVWSSVQKALADALTNISLKDLVNHYNKAL